MVTKKTLTPGGLTTSLSSAATKKVTNAAALKAAAAQQAQKKKGANVATIPASITAASKTATIVPPAFPDVDYKWNLPPHKLSLPVKPDFINNWAEQNSATGAAGLSNPATVLDQYRRGRIWWWYNAADAYVTSLTNNNAKSSKPAPSVSDLKERKYGFQFIWNPETWSNSVSLNTSITPTPLDAFSGNVGAFPANQQVSFTLRIDRTNDFAALRGLLTLDYTNNSLGGTLDSTISSLTGAYNTGYAVASQTDMVAKIKEMLTRGTIADIEYLYKVVNGDGWVNIAGVRTSDIGFLPATLTRLDIGPASYVGYINALNINHLTFSEDMTPMSTDVAISFNIMSSATIAGGNIANTVPGAPTN
jgi:hypothetical protein